MNKFLTQRHESQEPLNDHLLLDFSDGFAWVEPLGACARTVHDSVATVELEVVVQSLQTLLCGFITRVNDPTVRLHQHSRAEILVAIPPVPAPKSEKNTGRNKVTRRTRGTKWSSMRRECIRKGRQAWHGSPSSGSSLYRQGYWSAATAECSCTARRSC